MFVFFFKQKTAYEMRISDWSSDVCSSDLITDRPTNRRSRLLGIEIPIADHCCAFERIPWFLGGDDDVARSGVAALQRALWSCQYLDLPKAEHVLVEGFQAGQRCAVDDDGDASIGLASRSLAATVEIHFSVIVLKKVD